MNHAYKWVDLLNLEVTKTRRLHDVEIPFASYVSDEDIFVDRMSHPNLINFIYLLSLQHHTAYWWYMSGNAVPPPPIYIPMALSR